MAYWIIVERYENWLIDKAEGFVRFGIPETKLKLAAFIVPGDKLITYVSSGISKFSDIRVVLDPPFTKMKFGGNYDTSYASAISTRKLVILPEESWVPVQELKGIIKILGTGDSRQIFRTSLKRLDNDDGLVIEGVMMQRNSPQAPCTSSI
ncbi:hypothetical protein [Methylobacterium sp. Leaf125]|uniref:hypothetical protein n=1 Tax=Methylobacterium sp. Leaf125 TaxID=1736265 RepID=UPI0012E10AAB|nr:hypothetical protein [Methylobacterium sp. Leaf125]